MNKTDLIRLLVDVYHEDESYLKTLSMSELREILSEVEDHEDLFPNGDEYDDSYSFD